MNRSNCLRPAALMLAGLTFGACASPPPARIAGMPGPDAAAWPSNPIAAFTEFDPRARPPGADLPLVELFDDGTVLRVDTANQGERSYLVSRLAAPQLEQLRAELASMSGFWALDTSYDLAPGAKDQPTAEVILGDGSRTRAVRVHGWGVERLAASGSDRARGEGELEPAPAEFERAAKLLAGLEPTNARPWAPRHLEVMLWPYEQAQEPPTAWPAEWPRLDSAQAIQRGDSYSVILPGSELARVQEYLRDRSAKQPVLIGDRKWAIAYRLVMPGGSIARRIATPSAP